MTAKLAVVTGANRGIGLAFVKELLSRGYRVVGGVRKPTEATDLLKLSPNNVRVLPLDLESDSSIDAFKQSIGEEPIDLLINNAG